MSLADDRLKKITRLCTHAMRHMVADAKLEDNGDIVLPVTHSQSDTEPTVFRIPASAMPKLFDDDTAELRSGIGDWLVTYVRAIDANGQEHCLNPYIIPA